MLSSGGEASVTLAQGPSVTAAVADDAESGVASVLSAGTVAWKGLTSPSADGDTAVVPPELKVYVGDFPLLDILTAVPKAPLLKLLRCLYLSDLPEGYSVKFSGFPDLLLWRRGPSNPFLAPTLGDEDGEMGVTCANPCSEFVTGDSFRLVEVKSPHDVLSTKQIAVNDCLRRCGFDVSVAHVIDIAAADAEKRLIEEKRTRKQRMLLSKSSSPKKTTSGGMSTTTANTSTKTAKPC